MCLPSNQSTNQLTTHHIHTHPKKQIQVGAYLKQELGFENVGRLEGGIVSYARHLRETAATPAAADAGTPIAASKFKGINYVFDNRLGERITEDVLSQCDQCGTASDVYVNCANPNCHVRFIQCNGCGATYHGCCSRGCQQAIEDSKRRPPKGGYPAPPKTVYPPGVEEAFPLGPLPLSRQQGSQGAAVVPAGKARVWLEPGPFQNQRLNRAFDVAVDEFLAAEAGALPEPEPLQQLVVETEAVFPGGAHMTSGHSQGRLLAALARASGARTVLEVGTFTGYATLCLAEGVAGRPAARVVTCEIDERSAAIAEKAFAASPYGGHIELRREPAMELLQRLAALPREERPQFDLIFLDGDKKRYKDYYETILRSKLLAGGGLLVADNVLWKGLVPELGRRISQQGPDAELPVAEFEPLGFSKRQLQLARVLHDFNMHVRADPRTEQAFLPIRDGLLCVRWKGFERTVLPGAQESQ